MQFSLRQINILFYLVEARLVVASVVKTGGPGALVVRHLLRDVEFATVAQVGVTSRNGNLHTFDGL